MNITISIRRKYMELHEHERSYIIYRGSNIKMETYELVADMCVVLKEVYVQSLTEDHQYKTLNNYSSPSFTPR